MANNRPVCFISYCREGVDYDSVSYLVELLKVESEGGVEFLYDEDLSPGSDLPKFMELVSRADGIIILLTPQYKERIESRQPSGVYKEFSQIMQRYNDESSKSYNKSVQNKKEISINQLKPPFCLTPIIFSSTFDKSCPKEISIKKCVDFSDFRALKKNGKFYINKELNTKYKAEIKKTVSEIFTRHISSTDSFLKHFRIIHDSFFRNTKHEDITKDPKINHLLKEIFVKTHAYDQVSTQASYLLIGRKGSGKSTITHHLANYSEEKYKKHIEVNVNNFELEFLFKFLSDIPQHKDEQSITISQINMFENSWEIFLCICCMEALVTESSSREVSREEKRKVTKILKFLSAIVGGNILKEKLDYQALYQWCYARLFEVKDQILKESRCSLSDFSYDLKSKFKTENLIKQILTEGVLSAFEELLKKCNCRFLVSMDGFDTAFDEFRMGNSYKKASEIEMHERVQFELDWLRGFLHVMHKIKASNGKIPLVHLIDFCTTIPKDRFMEIKRNERDAYIYISKYHDIRWSGIELVLMLRKRLELLYEYSTKKTQLRPYNHLEEVLSKKVSNLPLEVEISSKGNKMPIFIAVLRCTFWRPREILIHFAKLIAISQSLKKIRREADNFAILQCITITTREIIEAEFINEFQGHCSNLKEIMQFFEKKKQILDLEEIKDTLEKVNFKFADKDKPIYDFNEKITFLYEIGFLGLEACETIVKRLKLLDSDVFWFNSGDKPLNIVIKENFVNCKFIIHPIFCEYLDLDVSNQRLTMNFNWGYLDQQEIHMRI